MAAYDELELAEAVAAGAEFMDAIDANITDDAERWFWVVNPETLNMGRDFGECGCVMAQHNPEQIYEPSLYLLLGSDESAFGFDVPGTPGTSLEPTYEALTALWCEAIYDRRATWFDDHPEFVISEGIRILRDADCPGCGWPETVAVGPSFEAGPERVECARRRPCGWSAAVVPA